MVLGQILENTDRLFLLDQLPLSFWAKSAINVGKIHQKTTSHQDSNKSL